MARKLETTYNTGDAVDDMIAGMAEKEPPLPAVEKPKKTPRTAAKKSVPSSQKSQTQSQPSGEKSYPLYAKIDPIFETALNLRKQFPKNDNDKNNATIVEAALREYLAEEVQMAQMLKERLAD